eukprot:351229-Chlamydomonas_euryale.AAC.1
MKIYPVEVRAEPPSLVDGCVVSTMTSRLTRVLLASQGRNHLGQLPLVCPALFNHSTPVSRSLFLAQSSTAWVGGGGSAARLVITLQRTCVYPHVCT